jgi:hypothetical protein
LRSAAVRLVVRDEAKASNIHAARTSILPGRTFFFLFQSARKGIGDLEIAWPRSLGRGTHGEEKGGKVAWNIAKGSKLKKGGRAAESRSGGEAAVPNAMAAELDYIS